MRRNLFIQLFAVAIVGAVLGAVAVPAQTRTYVAPMSTITVDQGLFCYSTAGLDPGWMPDDRTGRRRPLPSLIAMEEPEVVVRGGVPFLTMEGQPDVLFLEGDGIGLLYIDEFRRPIAVGLDREAREAGLSVWMNGIESISASSALKEEKTIYLPERLRLGRLDMPWCEGAAGSGVNEWIEFSVGENDSAVYLVNGYVSYSRPDLYWANERIRTATLDDPVSGEIMFMEFDDTPNPQRIDVESFRGRTVWLTITSVYPGERFTDTCVTGLFRVAAATDKY